MIVSIKSKELKLTLPVPLSLGGIAIRCISKEYLTAQEKKICLELFKLVKGSLKGYKGLKIVEVETQDGEHIIVKI